MEENYLISILGRQVVNGEPEEIEVTTFGQYSEKNGKRYIMYREYEDSVPSSKARTSILKVENGRVTLLRSGGDETRLVLEHGRRHLCRYDTGFGAMTVGVYTHEMKNELGDEGGRLSVRYTLDVNSALASVNEILVTVRPAGEKQEPASTPEAPEAAADPDTKENQEN
ncbi:MAG TPA: DUF1934 domain-containing protein [Candidatus Caccousia avicola]|uniref:DUF1934 domain-containing protein n=1 Tax=Candidatus Caccousia avicola TaxID=2840721 RepID=A0A9D1DFP7_9FIRM|nr:DUF1934 domain-containing protein [Candidatus Caccousia avicola]